MKGQSDFAGLDANVQRDLERGSRSQFRSTADRAICT